MLDTMWTLEGSRTLLRSSEFGECGAGDRHRVGDRSPGPGLRGGFRESFLEVVARRGGSKDS